MTKLCTGSIQDLHDKSECHLGKFIQLSKHKTGPLVALRVYSTNCVFQCYLLDKHQIEWHLALRDYIFKKAEVFLRLSARGVQKSVQAAGILGHNDDHLEAAVARLKIRKSVL